MRKHKMISPKGVEMVILDTAVQGCLDKGWKLVKEIDTKVKAPSRMAKLKEFFKK